MAKKIYTKKLTYAGMSLCLLSFFAFILSAAGALADPVGKLVYNNVFTNKIDFLFTPDIFAYVNTYGLSCALAIFSLVAFFTSARAKGKKKLDGAFAGFLILFPLVVMITKGIMIYYVMVKGHFSNAITMGYDNDKFRVALSLADDVCHLLRLSCFLSVDLLLQADLWAKISPLRYLLPQRRLTRPLRLSQ